jgi:hypothetical protein
MHWTAVPTTKSYVPGFVHSLTELDTLVICEQNAAGILSYYLMISFFNYLWALNLVA